MNKKALIIGGGISGLAAAITLESIGYETVIYEKATNLRNEGGGLTLWSNGTNALKRMGIVDDIYRHSRTINYSRIISSSGQTLSLIPVSKLASKYGTETVGILRSALYKILYNKLTTKNIKTNCRLTSVEETEEKVTAYFENGHMDSGDLLVGADGIYSTVRKNIISKHKLRFNGYKIWRGVITYEKDFANLGHSFEAWGKGLRFGIIPVSSSSICWFAIQNTKEPLVNEKISKEQLKNLFRNFVEPIPNLIERTNTEEISLKAINDLKPLKKWTTNRIALVGDAAHASTPNLGQGACLGLEDTVVLAKCLEEQSDLKSGLLVYESLRKKRADSIVKTSYYYGKVAQMENPLFCFVRNKLLNMSPSVENTKSFNSIIGYKV